MEDVKRLFPEESIPKYAGGVGGGIDNYGDWIQERLEDFPLP